MRAGRPERLLYLAAGAAMLTGLSWLTMLPGSPRAIAPHSALVVTPSVLIGGIPGLAIGLGWLPLLFVLWVGPAFEDEGPPLRSLLLLLVALALSIANLLLYRPLGMRFQGMEHVWFVTIASAGWWLLLVALLARAWVRQGPVHTRVFHLALFGWLAWYALPLLGPRP